MNTNVESLILESLREPVNAISYTVSQRLTAMFPDRVTLACNTADIDLLEFARERQCRAEPHPGIHSELFAQWHGPGQGVDETAGSSWYDVVWNEHTLSVLRLSWEAAFQTRVGYWIVAANRTVAKQFLIAIAEWCATVRGEIVVFEAGCWHKSKELYASIQGATFENLILPEAMKQEIQEDFKRFFASRDQYARYGIPWKRGVLFHGPPGNGKTHTLKALINRLGHPCLYVKSFKPKRFESEHETIRAVFGRARQTTPCLLVLEDLDSLVDDGNRSFFLNELDGFAANTGIVVLATTNHPERLDPAILNRPSRFDRKYAFGLPSRQERMEYLLMWNERSQPEMRLSEQGALAITDATDEFSFAYLKELWLSSMIRWIDDARPGGMDDIMAGQTAILREQMSAPMSEPAPATDGEDPMVRIMRSFTGH